MRNPEPFRAQRRGRSRPAWRSASSTQTSKEETPAELLRDSPALRPQQLLFQLQSPLLQGRGRQSPQRNSGGRRSPRDLELRESQCAMRSGPRRCRLRDLQCATANRVCRQVQQSVSLRLSCRGGVGRLASPLRAFGLAFVSLRRLGPEPSHCRDGSRPPFRTNVRTSPKTAESDTTRLPPLFPPALRCRRLQPCDKLGTATARNAERRSHDDSITCPSVGPRHSHRFRPCRRLRKASRSERKRFFADGSVHLMPFALAA